MVLDVDLPVQGTSEVRAPTIHLGTANLPTAITSEVIGVSSQVQFHIEPNTVRPSMAPYIHILSDPQCMFQVPYQLELVILSTQSQT